LKTPEAVHVDNAGALALAADLLVAVDYDDDLAHAAIDLGGARMGLERQT
jgi:hypothetical protein